MNMPKWSPSLASSYDSARNYAGPDLSEFFVAGMQNRDSGPLGRSNFQFTLDRLGGESETVEVIRAGHWACGWVEYILVSPEDNKAVSIGHDIADSLGLYPILDEEHFTSLQYQEAFSYWNDARLWERVRLCQEAEVSVFAARRSEDIPTDVLMRLEEV